MKKADLVEWQVLRSRMQGGLSIGFVPTMGNLHLGHQSLLETSVRENDLTVLSIYVNPTQFNNPDDWASYPSTIVQDCDLAEQCGVDYVLLPTYQEMYLDDYLYRIDEHEYSLILEGEKRPGHYQGVLTVLMKLLNCVQPDRLYMGEKDYQQHRLVKGMVDAFFLRVEVVLCPTVREDSGLAMSSRNRRLSSAGKQKAATLFRLLSLQGLTPDEVVKRLQKENIVVEYIEDYESRRFAAVTIDSVRLIDNVLLSEGEKLC